MLTCAGAVLPSFGLPSDEEPQWVNGLVDQLSQLSLWVRRESAPQGDVVLHCGMSSAAAWASAFRGQTPEETRLFARGNVLGFSRDRHTVRIVMHLAVIPPTVRA